MTAINVLIQRDAVHMVTDGIGVSEGDFKVHAIGIKQFVVFGIRAVCALRGTIFVHREINQAMRAAKFKSFDAMKCQIMTFIEDLAVLRSPEWDTMLWKTHPGGEFELFIAGWSETAGPQAFCIQRKRRDDDGWDLSIIEDAAAIFAPSDSAIDMMYRGQMVVMSQHTSGPSIEPIFLGLLSMQRLFYPVGGHADLTTITASDIKSRRIAKWPDAMGKAIDMHDQMTRVSIPILLGMPTFIGTCTGKLQLIRAGEISSAKGTIGSLAVESLSIGDYAVTVPQIQSFVDYLTIGGNYPGACAFTMYVDTTGLAGKPMNLFASFTGTLVYGGTVAVQANSYLIINDGIVATASPIDRVGFIAMSGSYAFTANGGVMAFSVRLDFYPAANCGMTNRTLFAQVAKR